MISPDSSQDGDGSRSQSILERAFHGPETSKASVERSSWLEQTVAPSAPQPSADSAERSERAVIDTPPPTRTSVEQHQPPAPKSSRLLPVLATAALVLLAFLAGWLARPDDTQPVNMSPITVAVAETTEAADTSESTVTVEPIETAQVGLLPMVLRFDRGTSTIDQEFGPQLSEFAKQLPAGSIVAVVGEGDPDATGPLNNALGALRADTVVAELVRLGVEPDRIVKASTASLNDEPRGQVHLIPLTYPSYPDAYAGSD